MPKAEGRFHEIGALDALADIAGSCAACQNLAVERVLCRPVSVGSGYVQSAHGLLPVPGPAALEILKWASDHALPSGVMAEQIDPVTGAPLIGNSY